MQGNRWFLSIFISFLTLIYIWPGYSTYCGAQEPVNEKRAVDCTIPPELKVGRPDPEGTKTPVKVGFYLIDLKDISDLDQTYTADVFFNITWNDARLSEKSLGKSIKDCIVDRSVIWYPLVLDANRDDGKELLEKVVQIDKDGNVNFKQRYIGTLSSDLNFEQFPFDTQELHFVLAAYGPDADKIEFVHDKEMSGSRDSFSIEGWKIAMMDPLITEEVVKEQGRSFARMDFYLLAEREKGYYLWKIVAPLCLIVLMAWAVFWIDPSQIGPQVGLSTATIFTLIAYRFTLGFNLPKISYFTKMDTFVFLSTVLVFTALGVAILTSREASEGRRDRAIGVEKIARVVYIVLFLLIALFALIL